MIEESNEIPSAPLYLIPTRIADVEPLEVLPLSIKKVVDSIDYFVVESEKSAREFIRRVYPSKSQPNLHIEVYNHYTDPSEIPSLLKHCIEGYPTGLIADEGAPALADPGADLILHAHQMGIRVIPLVGPSAVMLALISSGLNGNQFSFHGFLAQQSSVRKKNLKSMERRAQKGETQIFFESPLGNEELLDDVLAVCENETLLCIASNITAPSEQITTKSIQEWKHVKPSLDRLPTVFLLGSSSPRA